MQQSNLDLEQKLNAAYAMALAKDDYHAMTHIVQCLADLRRPVAAYPYHAGGYSISGEGAEHAS